MLVLKSLLQRICLIVHHYTVSTFALARARSIHTGGLVYVFDSFASLHTFTW